MKEIQENGGMRNIKCSFKENMKLSVEEYIFLSDSQRYLIPWFVAVFRGKSCLCFYRFPA